MLTLHSCLDSKEEEYLCANQVCTRTIAADLHLVSVPRHVPECLKLFFIYLAGDYELLQKT